MAAAEGLSQRRYGELIGSLGASPLLAVLRPASEAWLQAAAQQLEAAGVRHLELAWSEQPEWGAWAGRLAQRQPALRIGSASVAGLAALEATAAAGLAYAVSPILDAGLLAAAQRLGLALVPGVMTPTELHRARQLGCPLVKLFPAATLGLAYWRQLAGPLAPLPACIAAGGLGPADVAAWLEAGVRAVALGSCLFAGGVETPVLDRRVAPLMAQLNARLQAPPHGSADSPIHLQ